MSTKSLCTSLLRLTCLLLFGCVFASYAASSEPQGPRELFAQPGSIIPAQLAHVTSTVPGFVTKVRVKLGDAVKVGDVLAELDDAQAKLDVTLAQAKVELARARFQALKAGLAEKERQQSPGQEQLVVAELEIKSAEIKLSQSKCRLAATKIVAPIEGTVIEARAGVSNFVSSQQSNHSRNDLFDVADLHQLAVVVDVPENLFSQVFQGQNCRIEADAIPKVVYQGKVARVSPVVDSATRCFHTYVEIQPSETDSRIRPGMYTRVGFLAKE